MGSAGARIAPGSPALGPADLVCQQIPGQLEIHGDLVVYTLRRVVGGADRTELWTVDLLDGLPRPLTGGPGHDTCPRISPCGGTLAFLRSVGDAPAQVWTMPLPGGAPRALTAFPRGAHDLVWSSDGAALIVLAEDAASPCVHRVAGLPDEATPTAISLTGIDWRRDGDGDGGLVLYPRHLHRVDLGDGTTRRLTDGPWSASRPRTGPDGHVYFLADPDPDADICPSPQVFRVDADGEHRRALTRMPGGVLRYHLHGDGLRILARASADRPDDEPARWYDVADDGLPRPQGGEWAGDRRAGDESGGDETGGRRPHWTGLLGDETDLHDWSLELDDTAEVSTTSGDGWTVPADTATGQALYPGPGICGAIAQYGTRRVAVFAPGVGAIAPDVYALEQDGPRRLTEHGRWLEPFAAPGWERREVPGPAGPITVHLLLPPDGVAARGTVLALHGGPTGQWGVVPPVEALLLAGAGYRVAMPNIRGSIDRGPGWVAPLRGAWGEVDAQDALAVCDALDAAGLAEPGRLGVLGLSYGGFLTHWLIGVTDRFAAAVSENGVTNQVAAWAGCDVGPAFCRASDLGDPLTADGARRLWACSPLRHVADVRTPLLMLQGADDRTCPASDNEQFFVALRTLRREVEYVIYPEEGHLMQATGRIDRRIDRHRRVIAWFDAHLGREASR